jgi:hypothetical protein
MVAMKNEAGLAPCLWSQGLGVDWDGKHKKQSKIQHGQKKSQAQFGSREGKGRRDT